MNKNVGGYLLRGLLYASGSLPLGVHRFNARIIAFLSRYVIRYRLGVVRDNLTHAFPDKSKAEIRALENDFYKHFADLIVETVWFGACRDPRRLRKAGIVRIANPEVINSLYEKAPGVVSLYSHCGNWELLGGIGNYSDVPTCFTEENTCFVYREMKNKAWDEAMRYNRCAPVDPETFTGYIETEQLVRYVFSHRGEKKLYNINTDQRPYFYSPANIKVMFMGRVCKTMTGGAALARKFRMAVCYLGMRRLPGGKYEMVHIPICEDASKMEVGDIMKRYYELLEADIKADPANYLWTHKRWKWNYNMD